MSMDFDALAQEGVDNMIIEEFQGAPEDLDTSGIRELVGDLGEDYSDERLTELYEGRNKEAVEDDEVTEGDTGEGEGSGATEGDGESSEGDSGGDEGDAEGGEGDVASTTGWEPTTWHLVDEKGEKVEDISEMSAKDLLNLQIGYTVNKQGKASTIEQLVNQSTYSAVDQQRIQHLLQERNTAGTQLAEQNTLLEGLQGEKRFWDWVMRDATGQRFVDAQKKFEDALLDQGPEEAKVEVDQKLAEYHATGEKAYVDHILPALQTMAQAYSYDGKAADVAFQQGMVTEFDRVARELIEAEGSMLTQERLIAIVQQDLPHAAMQAGLQPIAQESVVVDDDKYKALEAEVANLKLAQAKNVVDGSPDSGSGSSPAGSTSSGFDASKYKSVQDIYDALEDDDENFGM